MKVLTGRLPVIIMTSGTISKKDRMGLLKEAPRFCWQPSTPITVRNLTGFVTGRTCIICPVMKIILQV